MCGVIFRSPAMSVSSAVFCNIAPCVLSYYVNVLCDMVFVGSCVLCDIRCSIL